MIETLFSSVDKYRDMIIEAQNSIWQNPETGYRENKTSKYMETAFEKLGYELIKPDDITGFCAVADTKKPGPEILVLAELDAVLCPQHPDSNKETGAVHCCGHSAQCAALLGIAAALKEQGALDDMCGKIRLCAVPAEELIELEYRAKLKEQKRITYYTGKSEFLHRGYFDDVDLAIMVHTSHGNIFTTTRGAVGCIAKKITYKGVSAHAGGNPWDGCNALYAATLGLDAVNSIRETFRDSDLIRFHPIITKGGDAVNAIPDNVVIESYVRGSNFDAIKSANKKVNQALIGSALSLGANIDIEDTPGYAPLQNSDDMLSVAEEAAKFIPDIPFYKSDSITSGSTDMGDLSCIMPVVHPFAPGAIGTSHGSDYYIENPDLACVASAKWQLAMLNILLCNNAERAKSIISDYKPLFKSKDEYFSYIDGLASKGNRIEYHTDCATVKL